MKLEATPINALVTAEAAVSAITGATAALGGLVQVDLSRHSLAREFILTVKLETNGTAVGSSRTITPTLFWSDNNLAVDDTLATRLAGRAQAATALAIPSVADKTYEFDISLGILRPKARYLYIGFTKTAYDAGAEVTVTVEMRRLFPVSSNIPT